jgi:uncharacterized protein YbjQ (UPF0145 family)
MDVRIFTPRILDGISITEYKGVVIFRNVRAINIIRDFFTSFRDIFGAKSKSLLMASARGTAVVISQQPNQAQ